MNKQKESAINDAEKDYYDINSWEYHKRTFSIDPSPFLSKLTNHLEDGASVLDIGCGSGRDLLWLKNKGYKTTGFERSSNLAELARKSTGCHVVNGDFCLYDFAGFQYDALLLIGALVHLAYSEFSPVLSHVSKALNKEGIIFLSMKEGSGQSHNRDGRVFTLWRCEDLEKVFTETGMVILDFARSISALESGDVWLSYVLARGENVKKRW